MVGTKIYMIAVRRTGNRMRGGVIRNQQIYWKRAGKRYTEQTLASNLAMRCVPDSSRDLMYWISPLEVPVKAIGQEGPAEVQIPLGSHTLPIVLRPCMDGGVPPDRRTSIPSPQQDEELLASWSWQYGY